MANKTLGTRQKMVFRLPQAQPQPPLAVPVRQRKCGPHEKAEGVQRQPANMLLVRLLEEAAEGK